MYSSATSLAKIAIVGRSCTGKTAVARRLHSELGGQLRCCGELIAATAESFGVTVANLSLEQHRSFDLGTWRWLSEAENIAIAEGNFLDRVVWGLVGVSFIRLTCALPARAARFGARRKSPWTIEEMVTRDRSEDALRKSLYGDDKEAKIEALKIDTTRQAVDQVASAIIKALAI